MYVCFSDDDKSWKRTKHTEGRSINSVLTWLIEGTTGNAENINPQGLISKMYQQG
jgi:hypothetical protein